MPSFCNHPTARQRGFSLIEAAIAMAIMAFGMLAIIGLQGMLHQKADLGRQRSEATRLAEQQLEQLRSFNAISSGTGLVAWADMASGSDTPTGSNASFTRKWTVGGAVTDSYRPIQVDVTWADRASTTGAVTMNTVTLNSVIAKVDPALAGALNFPLPGNGTIKRPFNRNLNIPVKSLDLGGGQSAYQLANNFAVVFNNATGYVVMKCTFTIVSASQLSQCPNYNAYIVAGYVSIGGKKPPATIPATGLNLSQTTGTVSRGSTECIYGPAKDQNTGQPIPGYNYYLCVMTVNGANGTWAGTIQLTGMSSGSPPYLVCRYQYPASTGADNNMRNVQPYVAVNESLDQQNYVITGDANCSNLPGTVLHQSCTTANASGCPANPD